jgi:hypothetical protein
MTSRRYRVSRSEFQHQRNQHLAHFERQTFGLIDSSGITDPQLPRDDKLRLQLEVGPACHAEKLLIFSPRRAAVAFSDVTRNLNTSPPQLRCKTVDFFFGKTGGEFVNSNRHLDSPLPHNKVPV